MSHVKGGDLIHKDYRSQCYQCLFYPESASEGWRDYILSLGCEVYISPLHDKDVKEDGSIKKAHYHAVFDFKVKKSLEQFIELLDGTGAVIDKRKPDEVHYPEKHGSIVRYKNGAIRYLIHADNPDKAQYNIEDIVCGSGGDIEGYFKKGGKEKVIELNEMIKVIDENNMYYFCDFVDYCRGHEIFWLKSIFEGKTAYVLGEYIKSRRLKCS